MDLKTINYKGDSKFMEMLNKMRTMQLNSSLLKSPSATKYGLPSFTSSPCSPSNIQSPKYNKKSLKKICLAVDDLLEHNIVEEMDLNKTYSSKTMDQKQLSLMLDALEDDDDNNEN